MSDESGRVCSPKTGWLSEETYCEVHGRSTGWPCTESGRVCSCREFDCEACVEADNAPAAGRSPSPERDYTPLACPACLTNLRDQGQGLLRCDSCRRTWVEVRSVATAPASSPSGKER